MTNTLSPFIAKAVSEPQKGYCSANVSVIKVVAYKQMLTLYNIHGDIQTQLFYLSKHKKTGLYGRFF